MYLRRALIVTAVAALSGLVPVQQTLASPGLTTQDLTGGLTPQDLVDTLVGAGVVTSNVSFDGAPHAGGTFAGGADIVGFESGVILSSGLVSNVVGPNANDGITGFNGTGGDPDLTALAGQPTFDRTILKFDFVPDDAQVFFQYVFGSDEYNEFVNTQFNDVFAFFVNGENCATVEGDPVSINTINNGNPFGTDPRSHPELFRNNDLDDGGGTIDTEMDGLTTVLTCQSAVTPGVPNEIKLAIADAGDAQLDSNVFLKAGSFSTEPPEEEGTDLAVGKSDNPDPVTGGGVVQYLIDITNQGEEGSGVTLTDMPSAGSVLSASGEGWDCAVAEDGSSATCTLPELAPGTAAPTVEVLVQAPSEPGVIENTATVAGDGTDPDPGDNTAVEQTTVEQPGGDQFVTFCPPSGCEFQTGDDPNEDDNTVNRVEVPAGGDGSVTRISETITTFPCGGNPAGGDGTGQETNFEPPTGLTDPANPIKVTTTWDVSVWPIHNGNSDPGVSGGERGQGQVKICMKKLVQGDDGPMEVVFRVPRCHVMGIADPSPCWDMVSRDADDDISVRFLLLSPDPQWRR